MFPSLTERAPYNCNKVHYKVDEKGQPMVEKGKALRMNTGEKWAECAEDFNRHMAALGASRQTDGGALQRRYKKLMDLYKKGKLGSLRSGKGNACTEQDPINTYEHLLQQISVCEQECEYWNGFDYFEYGASGRLTSRCA